MSRPSALLLVKLLYCEAVVACGRNRFTCHRIRISPFSPLGGWGVVITGAVPDFGETVAFGFEGEEIAVDGHDGVDPGPAGFEGLSGPDVADAGEVVGLRGGEEVSASPA